MELALKAKNLVMLLGIIFSINIRAQEHIDMDTTDNMMMMMNMNEHSEHNIFEEGSGTSGLPASSPMYGYMSQPGNWMLMFHGNLFLRYDAQDITKSGSRGSAHFDAPDWFMMMAENKLNESNKIKFSLMLSLDPFLVGGRGYPLLFQTGESWKNQPLVDRQHPHDLFSELSAAYTYSFSNDFALNLYLGYPGEPALGPPAFMHRPSAESNPDSPIGHHWQDATHITFGTATVGLQFFNSKIEGSVFNGREPNENRYNFDKPHFDSYSGRITTNLWKDFSFQVSYAYLKSPEWLHPEESIHRTTVSLLHSKKVSDGLIINSAIIWGNNYISSNDKEGSILLETDISFSRVGVYGRYESVQKSAGELSLDQFNSENIFDINALTVGTHFTLLTFSNTDLMAGIQGSLFIPPQELRSLYGKNPVSLEVYLRITPGVMKM